MLGRLDDRVLLGMEPAAEFVTLTGRNAKFLAQTADFRAMGDTGRRSVIARGEDILPLV